jgi:CTD small phosphatase-like protein 2
MTDDCNLPIVIPPFLPPLNPYSSQYTLVLDLDETLIHYIETVSDTVNNPSAVGTFLVRPGAPEFLKEMSKYYELVIFTAAMQDVN